MIHFDSSFLIDLQRELVSERPGPAFDLIESFEAGEMLGVSVHVVCELRAGAELTKKARAEHEAIDHLLSGLLVAYPDDRFPILYGRLLAATRRTGRGVASMDLLIGTAALLEDAVLVTRNVKDFSKIPGLRVLSY
jgi:predicted nucleic acid-binding protein